LGRPTRRRLHKGGEWENVRKRIDAGPRTRGEKKGVQSKKAGWRGGAPKELEDWNTLVANRGERRGGNVEWKNGG